MIKAIETKYKGYRFRSRLEARWAVFFDALGVKWEYESEGFDLGEYGLYLPDFFLPEFHNGLFVEVKPEGLLKEHELSKIKGLYLATRKNILLAKGTPSLKAYLLMGEPFEENECDWIDVCFNKKYTPRFGRSYEQRLFWQPGCIEDADCFEAVDAARSARFEYGESGARP